MNVRTHDGSLMSDQSEVRSSSSQCVKRRIAAWLSAAALVLLTLLAYQPVWHAGFIFDDDVMLTGNPAIHAADGLRSIWWSSLLPDYFPMTSTMLWLEWRLW